MISDDLTEVDALLEARIAPRNLVHGRTRACLFRQHLRIGGEHASAQSRFDAYPFLAGSGMNTDIPGHRPSHLVEKLLDLVVGAGG